MSPVSQNLLTLPSGLLRNDSLENVRGKLLHASDLLRSDKSSDSERAGAVITEALRFYSKFGAVEKLNKEITEQIGSGLSDYLYSRSLQNEHSSEFVLTHLRELFSSNTSAAQPVFSAFLKRQLYYALMMQVGQERRTGGFELVNREIRKLQGLDEANRLLIDIADLSRSSISMNTTQISLEDNRAFGNLVSLIRSLSDSKTLTRPRATALKFALTAAFGVADRYAELDPTYADTAFHSFQTFLRAPVGKFGISWPEQLELGKLAIDIDLRTGGAVSPSKKRQLKSEQTELCYESRYERAGYLLTLLEMDPRTRGNNFARESLEEFKTKRTSNPLGIAVREFLRPSKEDTASGFRLIFGFTAAGCLLGLQGCISGFFVGGAFASAEKLAMTLDNSAARAYRSSIARKPLSSVDPAAARVNALSYLPSLLSLAASASGLRFRSNGGNPTTSRTTGDIRNAHSSLMPSAAALIRMEGASRQYSPVTPTLLSPPPVLAFPSSVGSFRTSPEVQNAQPVFVSYAAPISTLTGLRDRPVRTLVREPISFALQSPALPLTNSAISPVIEAPVVEPVHHSSVPATRSKMAAYKRRELPLTWASDPKPSVAGCTESPKLHEMERAGNGCGPRPVHQNAPIRQVLPQIISLQQTIKRKVEEALTKADLSGDETDYEFYHEMRVHQAMVESLIATVNGESAPGDNLLCFANDYICAAHGEYALTLQTYKIIARDVRDAIADLVTESIEVQQPSRLDRWLNRPVDTSKRDAAIAYVHGFFDTLVNNIEHRIEEARASGPGTISRNTAASRFEEIVKSINSVANNPHVNHDIDAASIIPGLMFVTEDEIRVRIASTTSSTYIALLSEPYADTMAPGTVRGAAFEMTPEQLERYYASLFPTGNSPSLYVSRYEEVSTGTNLQSRYFENATNLMEWTRSLPRLDLQVSNQGVTPRPLDANRSHILVGSHASNFGGFEIAAEDGTFLVVRLSPDSFAVYRVGASEYRRYAIEELADTLKHVPRDVTTFIGDNYSKSASRLASWNIRSLLQLMSYPGSAQVEKQ